MRTIYSTGLLLILFSFSVLAIDYYPNTIIMNKIKNITNTTAIYINGTSIDELYLRLDTSNDPLTNSLEISGNVTPEAIDFTDHVIMEDGTFMYKDLMGFSGYDFRWPDFMGMPGGTYMTVGNILGGYALEVYQPMKISKNEGLEIYNEGETANINIRSDNVVYNQIVSSSGKDLRLSAGAGSDGINLMADEVECTADFSTVGFVDVGSNLCVGGECTNDLSKLNKSINASDIDILTLCIDGVCAPSIESINSSNDWVTIGSTQSITGSKTFSNANNYFTGNYLDIGYQLRHDGDTNTLLQFSPDYILLQAGAIPMIILSEGTVDTITMNPNGYNVDFYIESDARTNALHLDASEDTLKIETGIKYRYLIHTGGNQAVADSEYIYLINSSAGSLDVDLPQADKSANSVFIIKDIGGQASSNPITIDPYGSEKIDSLDDYNISYNYGSLTILGVKELNGWVILSKTR